MHKSEIHNEIANILRFVLVSGSGCCWMSSYHVDEIFSFDSIHWNGYIVGVNNNLLFTYIYVRISWGAVRFHGAYGALRAQFVHVLSGSFSNQ